MAGDPRDRLPRKTLLLALPPRSPPAPDFVDRKRYLVLHDERYNKGDTGRVSIEDAGKHQVMASTNFIATKPEELRSRREAMAASLEPILASRSNRRSHSSRSSLLNASAASLDLMSPFHDGDPLPAALSLTPRAPSFSKPWTPAAMSDMVRSGPTQEHGVETVDPKLSPWWIVSPIQPPPDPRLNRAPTAASRIVSPAVALSEFKTDRQSLATVCSPAIPRDARIVMQAARLTPRFADEFGTIRRRLQTAQAGRARTATLAGIMQGSGFRD